MSTKRILIGTPCKGGLSIEYMDSLMKSVAMDPLPGYHMETTFAAGGSVNMARNKLASEAMDKDYDELLQIDADLLFTRDHIVRILSHDADIVGGIYTKRQAGKATFLFVPKPGATIQENGLLEANGLATGWLRTKVSALRKIRADNPHLEHEVLGKDGKMKQYSELFPMGVVGPRTPEARLEKVKAILAALPKIEHRKGFIPAAPLEDIRTAIFEEQPLGRFLGEDYFFSRLARKSGFTLWADVGAPPIGHLGTTCFPITKEMVGFDPDEELALPDAHNF